MKSVLVLGTLVGLTATAHADSDDIVSRPIVLDRGHVLAVLTAEIELAPHFVGKPLQLAPDVWYGVTSRLTVGLIHSDRSLDRIQTGWTFCATSGDLTCQHFYGGSGVDARYRILDGDFSLAPRARVLVRDVDPFKPAITLGALLHWQHARYAITSDPYLQLGLANTDQGNRSQLWLPVALTVQPTCRWAITLHTGYNTELATWRDGWHTPIALEVRARVTPDLDASILFGFPSLLGPQNTPKRRALFFSIAYRI